MFILTLQAGHSNIRVQASCSLQFVPWDVSCEEDLTKKVGGEVLAFAVQKVQEIVALADAVPDITSGKQVKLTRPWCRIQPQQ